MTESDHRQWGRTGTKLARSGNWHGAAQAFRRAVLEAPDDRRGWEGLGRSYLTMQDLDAARDLLETIQGRFPDWVFTHLLAGHLQKAHGHSALAIASYQQALHCQEDNGEALYGLVDLQIPDVDEPLARHARALASAGNAPIQDRINAGFACGRILDRAGQYEPAFEYFLQANSLAREDLTRQGIDYSPQQRQHYLDQVIALYPADLGNARLPALPIDLTPVFVVGLPRTGTTLIEQILASHPDVEAAGELTLAHECEQRFNSARNQAGRTGPVDPGDAGDASLLEDAREQYIDGLFERDLQGPYVVDKMPANFELLGFLHLLFPESPLVHCKRDLRATGFSLFSANFGGHEPYYHDLKDLADYFRQYQRIMRHWQSVCAHSLYTVLYEELVTNPEQHIPTLLEQIGLSPHEGCLRFHETKRPVLTASHAQVRQPIYRSAINHWKNYEACLGPLLPLTNND